MVGINYRLGPLGFLSIPRLNITGNMGLKDQQLAMEWVQHNIANFGGDPRRVTLAGWSAGGASVTYHMFNKRSRPLFKQAIVMSGNMLNPWAYLDRAGWCAQNYLDYVGYETKAQLQVVDFLELMPRLRESMMFAFFGMYHFCFVPTLEPSWAEHRFLRATPLELVEDVDAVPPTLIGFTELESATMYPIIDYYMSNVVFPNANESIHQRIQAYIQTYLLARFSNEADRQLFLIKLASMSDTHYDTQKFMDLAATGSADVYGYQFSFDGRFGNFKDRTNKRWRDLKGPVHGDDLGYLFVPFNENSLINEDFTAEIKISIEVVEMWTNFVKYG